MRWLALFFPRLPLDALPTRPLPSAVVDRGQVVVADELAQAAGIVPGMRAATARGRLPELTLLARDPAAETALLDTLACWAGSFTPTLSVQPPATLLLDVGACLRLFGGATALADAVLAGCRDRVSDVCWAGAPTPRAAHWLARGAVSGVVPTLEALPDALSALPTAVAGWRDEVLARLAGFGARTLGDVMALPRTELMRRLGAGVGIDLACALGDQFEQPAPFHFPDLFGQEMLLPGGVRDATALLFGAGRLLENLCGWLSARQAGVSECRFELLYEPRPGRTAQAVLTLRLQQPSRDGARFQRVLREQLAVLTLASPVAAIRLQAGPATPLAGVSRLLSGVAAIGADDRIDLLIERLRSRLGETAVFSLACAADHRPEFASVRVAVGCAAGDVPGKGDRPLWLLRSPERLAEQDGRPLSRRAGGALTLLRGPERIESGWWDDCDGGGDVARDYFVARAANHRCYWIYREHDAWFLQGIFA